MANQIDGTVGARAPRRATFAIQLLGEFGVRRNGQPVTLPESTWRLVALLALSGRDVRRSRAAESLWPDAEAERALGNLRSCLWRVRKVAPGLLDARGDPLALGPAVRVDLADLVSLSAQLETGGPVDVVALQLPMWTEELLPEFTDDFVTEHREMVRQLSLRTLELASRRLLEGGSYGAALRLALLAVSHAPLRESAHELVLQAHLAEGNVSEAVRHYRAVTNLLRVELGIAPSERVSATLTTVVPPAEPWTRAPWRGSDTAT